MAGRADSAAQAWKEKATKGNFVVDTDAVARWRADRRGGLAALSAAACASQLRALTKARGNPLLPAALLNAKEELELRQVKAHVSTVDWALFVALLHHLRHLSISARELRRSDVCTLLLPSLLPTSGLDDFNAAYSKAARAFDAVIPKGGAPLPDWATAAPSPARPAPAAAAVDEVVDPLEMSYGGSEIPSELELSSSGVMKASPLRGAGGGFGRGRPAWRRARRRRRRRRGATRMRRRVFLEFEESSAPEATLETVVVAAAEPPAAPPSAGVGVVEAVWPRVGRRRRHEYDARRRRLHAASRLGRGARRRLRRSPWH